jgi:hypothetical protein
LIAAPVIKAPIENVPVLMNFTHYLKILKYSRYGIPGDACFDVPKKK